MRSHLLWLRCVDDDFRADPLSQSERTVMRRPFAAFIFLLVPVVCLCCLPMARRLPLRNVPTKVGALYPASQTGVAVVVHDMRRDPGILGQEILQHFMDPDRVFSVFGTDKPGAVADVFKAAASDAARALGFREGADVTVDIVIKRFQVDGYSYSYAPMNCVAYGEIEAALTPAGGVARRSRTSRLAYWEDAVYTPSPYRGTQAISRIYTQAAWESTFRILQKDSPSQPEVAAVSRALQIATGAGSEYDRREAIFWLGLAGKGDGAVRDALVTLFREAPEQEISEAAAEAIGMLGLADARSEIEEVLAASRKYPNWDIEDTEAVWYLLKALYLLGTPDLERRIPSSSRLHNRDKLTELIRFLDAGEFPELSPALRQDFQKGVAKLKRPGS